MTDEFQLTGRQADVLNAIVQDFISRAEPVSSKVLSFRQEIHASSATIRNVMASLESLGLIEQPHTSAGRQPTDKGYRFYLDSLVKHRELRKSEKNVIWKKLENVGVEEEAPRIASEVLSRLSKMLGVASFSQFQEAIIRRIQLIEVAEKRALMVVILVGGPVHTITVELEISLRLADYQKIEDAINEKISGKSVSFLNNNWIDSFVGNQKPGFRGPVRIFSRSILKLFKQMEHAQVEISGAKSFVNQSEIEKIEDIEGIIELFEDKKTLVHFLRQRGNKRGVHVTIGNEHKMNILKTHSVITSTFFLQGIKGTLGIIGPTRMDYSKMISVVDFTAKALNQVNPQR